MAVSESASHPHLRVARDGPVLTITLCNVARRNAQTPSMWLALAELAATLDPAVRVVVLGGDGPSFSSGLDRAMLTGAGIAGEPSLLAAARRGAEPAARMIEPYQCGFSAWADVDAIVVASVQGHAIGAAFQLALAADLRIVAEDVQFAMRETSLGLVPDLAGTRELVGLVGYSRALEICMTGRSVGAAEAVAIGLAAAAVPNESLAARTSELVATLLAAPEHAVRELKPLLRRAMTGDRDDQLRREREAQGRLLSAIAAAPDSTS